MAASVARFKLVFFVPESALEACKAAIFAAGAGRFPGQDSYTEWCWTAMGTGQFRPRDGANPNIGSLGKLEEVKEARVETLCVGKDTAKKAVDALKRLVFILRLLSSINIDRVDFVGAFHHATWLI